MANVAKHPRRNGGKEKRKTRRLFVIRHSTFIILSPCPRLRSNRSLNLQSSTIGPGDPLFIAFFFAIVLRESLNTRGTLPAVYVLLTLSMLAVQFGVPAVGALAPLGIAVILANYRYFKFSREENFAMLYAGLIAVAASTGFFFYAKLHMFRR